MPHWNASDFETIFDSDSGEGTSGTFTTLSGSIDPYTINSIIDHGLVIIDEDLNVPEKSVLLQFLKHKLTNTPVRGDTWSDGSTTYTIQSLASDDGIIETWSVTS